MTDRTIVTIRDFRRAGICTDARFVFFEPHGLDWRGFVKNGISVGDLRATGDHLTRVDELERYALERIEGAR